jgi:hypothetical protein
MLFSASQVEALTLSDGGVHTIDYQLDDNVWVEDSPSNDFTTLNLVDGGIIKNWVEAMDYSHINITGGSIGFELFTNHNSQAIMTGGSIAYDLNTFDNSEVFIFGGVIGDSLNIQNNGQITISGSGFEINGNPVDYGIYTALDYPLGTLSGTLTNGDPMNNDFEIYDDASIVLVPEPATMTLLALGVYFLRSKNRD